MPPYSVRALVLRKTKLGETDLILTLLAEDGRQVRAVAKGARKPGSRFGARLEAGAVADLLLHTGRSLDHISEAEMVESHSGLREDYDRSCAAAVVLDFCDKVTVEVQAEHRMFPLAVTTLGVLASADPADVRALACAFLVKAMAVQGYRPQLGACIHCACEAATGGFSLEAGGVVCPDCGGIDGAALPLSGAARHALAALLKARMAEVPGLEIPEDVLAEVSALVRAFVQHHLPARMKSLAFLG